MKKSLLFISFFISLSVCQAQKFKQMMNDNSVNVYDVVKEAENYFKTHDKNVKGSGWKPYQRWLFENESRYYPSGNRTSVDPFLITKAYKTLKQSITAQNKTVFPAGWEDLGPYNVGTLSGHYSPGLGRINTFYVNENNTDQIFIGSSTGGFWKTEDGGNTWSGTTDFLPATGVNAITGNPNNADEVLINVQNAVNKYSHGIYRSTDGGDTWNVTVFNPTGIALGLGNGFRINKIAYSPLEPNLVMIATTMGLYRSTDNLATYSLVSNNNNLTYYNIAFHPTNSDIIYAYNENDVNNVYVSTNKGASFTTTSLGTNTTYYNIKTSAACPNCVYVASSDGFWKSTDSGVSFTKIHNSVPAIRGFAVSDLNDQNILMGYVDASFSIDGGANFNTVAPWSLYSTNGNVTTLQTSYNTSTNYIHADMQYATCINGSFYTCTDGFLVKSDNNGQDWTKLTRNIGIRMNYSVGVSQSDHRFSICGSQDNGISLKRSNDWLEVYGADGMESIIHPLNPNWLIYSTQNGNRKTSFDGGINTIVNTPSNQSGYWIAPLVYDPNDHQTIYSFGKNVYKSTNFGTTWTNVGNIGLTGWSEKSYYGAIAENNSQIMVATESELIRKTTNGGSTWSSIRNNLPNRSIKDVTFDPNDDNVIIVVYNSFFNDGEKVFITTNGGTNWTNITHNLGDMPINAVVIDHTDDSTIYLGAEIGVYKKKMADNNWTLYNTDLPNVGIKDLEIMYGTNTIRAATWGRGLWEFTLDGRQNFPAILTTTIETPPTFETPLQNSSQKVTATIDYDATLTNVEVKWSVNNQNFDNTIPMTNTSGNIWESNTSLPTTTVDDKIYFKVVATGNNNDTTETYKFMYKVIPLSYCDASGLNSTDDNITNVKFNTINKTSAATSYSDFTAISTDVTQGNPYTFEVDYNSYGASTTDQVKFWIDFNNDYDFEDAGEEFSFTPDNGANGPFSQQVQIPATATVGQTRMRVRLNDTNVNAATNPCGNTSYGEVEDYTINIQENTALAVTQNELNSKINVYPNPTTGQLNIDLGKNYKQIAVTLTNVLGQIVLNKVYTQTQYINLNVKANTGVYFLTLNADGNQTFIKVVKE